MKKPILKQMLRPALALVAALLLAGPSVAADVTMNLTAEARNVTMPDGTVVPMWGFFDAAGADWSPGPQPVGLQEGDTLTINLTNTLTLPVSIVIPGQAASLSPVTVTDAQGRTRVKSFTAETPAASGPVTYEWTNLRPGTYIYHSGTNPGRQVPMGLYGVIKVDAAPGEAYTGAPYNREVLLLYSEIDPDLNATDPAEVARPRTYKPRYFLINGQPFDPLAPAPLPAGLVGATTLVRFANIGLKSHMPLLLNGPHMQVIAEDGHPYPYAKEQYLVNLAPGKTMDALWQPTAEGTFPLFDRSHHLTTGASGNGGMLAQLAVSTTCPGDLDFDLDVDGLDAHIYAGIYGPGVVPTLGDFTAFFGTICP